MTKSFKKDECTKKDMHLLCQSMTKYDRNKTWLQCKCKKLLYLWWNHYETQNTGLRSGE